MAGQRFIGAIFGLQDRQEIPSEAILEHITKTDQGVTMENTRDVEGKIAGYIAENILFSKNGYSYDFNESFT